MVTPVPVLRTAAPVACAAASAGVKLTPVPLAPDVPTDVTVTACPLAPESTRNVWPTLKLIVPVPAPPARHTDPTFATLMLVSPAAAGAASVVAGPAAVPTEV